MLRDGVKERDVRGVLRAEQRRIVSYNIGQGPAVYRIVGLFEILTNPNIWSSITNYNNIRGH